MAKQSATKKKKITLSYEGEPGREVLVAGSFNSWEIDQGQKGAKVKKMKEDTASSGKYTINMFLPLGDYEYKFFCDGHWYVDRKAEEQVPNQLGTFNSILRVA